MFKAYSIETAPSQSKALLKKVCDKFGFIPNQDKILAVSPSIYQAYNHSFDLFLGSSTLSLLEGQIVLMAVSYENNSPYCMALHSWGMEMTQCPQHIIDALRDNHPIKDVKLEVLRSFTRQLITTKGHLEEEIINNFLSHGYTHQNIIEIIGGIASKSIANYSNVIAKTSLDETMVKYKWEKTDK